MSGSSTGLVIAATGLHAEARIAARVARVASVVGGGNAKRLEHHLHQSLREGPAAIISFGIAAGLTPEKGPGTCIIASEVVHDGTRYAADARWAERLQTAIAGAELAKLAGVDLPLRTAQEKHALSTQTGAVAADMESHIVARLAMERRLPFAALRVIADPAERDLPQSALVGMGKDGHVNVLAVLVSLARAPGQFPSLLKVAADTRRAFAELFRCHRLVGPGFGFFDLR